MNPWNTWVFCWRSREGSRSKDGLSRDLESIIKQFPPETPTGLGLGCPPPLCFNRWTYALHNWNYLLPFVFPEAVACGMVLSTQFDSHQLDPRARIVGGTECPKGECPWQVNMVQSCGVPSEDVPSWDASDGTAAICLQVLLVYKGKGFCGGVIYKPTWVLTASHCMEDIDIQFLTVVAGIHFTSSPTDSLNSPSFHCGPTSCLKTFYPFEETS